MVKKKEKVKKKKHKPDGKKHIKKNVKKHVRHATKVKDRRGSGAKAGRKTHHVRHGKHISGKRKAARKSVFRVATGIRNFDKLIGKGFEKDSTNLLVGGSGSGKTIFATQFLVEGMKRGEKCLYVTFEEKKEQFYSNMRDFGWDLEAYEKKGLFTFLEYTPIKVKTMLEEGGGTIESVILKKKISRIVIDSITSFELLFNDELEKREAALSLFSMIRDWDATAFLTLEEEPSSAENVSSKTLEFESDSITILYFIRENNKPDRARYLEVIKMRGTRHSKRVYPFEIGKKGIKLRGRPVTRFSVK